MSIYDFKEWQKIEEANIRAEGWSKADFKKFKDAKLKLFKTIAKVFAKHDVKWWPDTGTLLGIWRDGDLMDRDNDVDLSVKIEDVTKKFFDAIEEMNDDDNLKVEMGCHKHYVEGFEKGEIEPINKWYKIHLTERTKDKEIFCDLLIWFPHKDTYFAWDGKLYRHKKANLEKFSSIVFKGVNIRIPKSIKPYLVELYGEDWETPNDKWKEHKDLWSIGSEDSSYMKEIKNYKYKV